MDGDALPVSARLQAWRAHGADRMDPLRFGFIEALASRARAHEGEARRLLDARLCALVAAYADDLARWPPRTAPTADGPSPAAGGSPLRDLVSALQPRASAHEPAEGDAPARPAPAVLEDARRLWTQVRTGSQLRASLDDVPADAGPLNSGMLVHRALHFMQSVSPGYLQHFIAYADTLSSLEQLQHAVAPPAPAADAPRTPRRAPRKRKA